MAKNEKVPVEAFLSQNIRQIDIENWGAENQKKLYDSRVLILGSGILGQMMLGCLSAIGVGNILIMDNKRSSKEEADFMFPKLPYLGFKKMGRIEKIAKAINENIKIGGVHSKFSPALLDYFAFCPDVIVDTQNSPIQKEHVLDYAVSRKRRFISAYCNHKKAVVSVFNPEKNGIEDILNDGGILEDDQFQGCIAAGVCAGIMADEVRKSVFSLNEFDTPLESRVKYNMESLSRTRLESDNQIEMRRWNVRALVAGAGAVGNYVALNLALSGFRHVDIMDYDKVEYHNLARQILFYGKVGEEKASVLSSRIKEFSKVKSRAWIEKLTESSRRLFKKNRYDIVFGCFDNQKARYHLNDFATEFEIPYIDGGTSPLAGTLSVYYPGKTTCIRCKKSLTLSSKSASCQRAAPSVIVPNIIVGSLMVGEAINLLSGNVLDKRIVYDSLERDRLYMAKENPQLNSCGCKNGN